jgi:hypothetical protein
MWEAGGLSKGTLGAWTDSATRAHRLCCKPFAKSCFAKNKRLAGPGFAQHCKKLQNFRKVFPDLVRICGAGLKQPSPPNPWARAGTTSAPQRVSCRNRSLAFLATDLEVLDTDLAALAKNFWWRVVFFHAVRWRRFFRCASPAPTSATQELEQRAGLFPLAFFLNFAVLI